MRKIMSVLVLIASIVLVSCAGTSGGNDDGAVNGYIPLVGGNLPTELAPRKISFSSGLNSFCMIGFAISTEGLGDFTGNSDDIYNFITSAPIVSGWSNSTEPISDGDTFTYNYLGTVIVLTANITEVTNNETGVTGYKITYTSNFSPLADSEFSKSKYNCSVAVSFDMTTNKIVSNQEVFFKAEDAVTEFVKHGKTKTHMEGTWSDTLYFMSGERDERIAFDDRDDNNGGIIIPGSGRLKFIDFVNGNISLPLDHSDIEYKKTSEFTGVKRVETSGNTVCWYYLDTPVIQPDNQFLDVWNSY